MSYLPKILNSGHISSNFLSSFPPEYPYPHSLHSTLSQFLLPNFSCVFPSSHLKSLPKFFLLYPHSKNSLSFTLAESNQITYQQTRQECHKNSNNNPQKRASLLKISNCFQCYDIRLNLLWLPSNTFFPHQSWERVVFFQRQKDKKYLILSRDKAKHVLFRNQGINFKIFGKHVFFNVSPMVLTKPFWLYLHKWKQMQFYS